MNEAGETFNYSGKSYQIMQNALGVTVVYRRKKKGLEPVQGVMAFRVVSAYKRKVNGEKVVRRPRTFAKKPNRKVY
ncbi:MAG: hypothetical protein ACRCYY_02615 [Trueperaceae bacterium]